MEEAEDPIQNSCDNINRSPTPINQVVLVYNYTNVKKNASNNVYGIQLRLECSVSDQIKMCKISVPTLTAVKPRVVFRYSFHATLPTCSTL